MATFNDLPLDILILIFPYLEPGEFLNLCTTCRSLAQPSIRYESSYWSYQTQTKFRVPNRPAVQADGLRWQRLYKRLRTQSRVYTWGQNTHGCLGREDEPESHGRIPRRGMPPRLPNPRVREKSAWPEEMEMARDIGVISDIQCGGWSTSLLTSKGVIYTVGILNGMNHWDSQTRLTPLGFDGINNELPKARTAIKQFSSGRTHILGLSDDCTIFSWHNIHSSAKSVTLSGLDGAIQCVVAGWSSSSALVKGHGIALWNILGANQGSHEHVLHDWTLVPKSGYKRPRRGQRSFQNDGDDLGETVGEVISYVVLEGYVVFVTDLRRAFACRIHHDAESGVMHDVFELFDMSADAKDVQGSFRNFAVFKNEGEVLIANQDYLDTMARRAFRLSDEPPPQVTRIPALQNTGVMQIAFGDHHYHALHADGSISSYGVEPGGSSALGLGGAIDMDLPHGMLRGIKNNPWNRDGVLLPHAYAKGRKIWFQKENEAWLRFLATGGKNKEEAQERMRLVGSMPPVQGEVSEWVEQMGSGWDSRAQVKEVDEDGLGAYFALSVAAAGWHSGALVLVNDKVVNAVRESCFVDIPSNELDSTQAPPIERLSTEEGTSTWFSRLARNFLGLSEIPGSHQSNDSHETEQDADSTLPPKGKKWIWADQNFPRLRLDHGVEMPGDVPFSEWKVHKPDWKLMWTGDERKIFGVSGWIIEE